MRGCKKLNSDTETTSIYTLWALFSRNYRLQICTKSIILSKRPVWSYIFIFELWSAQKNTNDTQFSTPEPIYMISFFKCSLGGGFLCNLDLNKLWLSQRLLQPVKKITNANTFHNMHYYEFGAHMGPCNYSNSGSNCTKKHKITTMAKLVIEANGIRNIPFFSNSAYGLNPWPDFYLSYEKCSLQCVSLHIKSQLWGCKPRWSPHSLIFRKWPPQLWANIDIFCQNKCWFLKMSRQLFVHPDINNLQSL